MVELKKLFKFIERLSEQLLCMGLLYSLRSFNKLFNLHLVKLLINRSTLFPFEVVKSILFFAFSLMVVSMICNRLLIRYLKHKSIHSQSLLSELAMKISLICVFLMVMILIVNCIPKKMMAMSLVIWSNLLNSIRFVTTKKS